jgi:uncharacterized protein YkwD
MKQKNKLDKNLMNKTILNILFMFLVLNAYSQTPLELKVFQKINDYRVENGLHRLKWDDATYKSTVVHTEYMVKNSELCHTEDSETPRFTNRLMLFQDNSYIVGNENVSSVSINDIEDSIDKIADKIVSAWKTSKGHDRAMLGNGSTVGAISCGDGIKIKNNYTLKIKYSTFVLWNNQL